VEFKAGPSSSSSRKRRAPAFDTAGAVCVWINDRNTRGAYDGPDPMVAFHPRRKIVAVNGGSDDNIIGWRYARTGCNDGRARS